MKVVPKIKAVQDFMRVLTLFQDNYYAIPQWAHVIRALPIIADRHHISVDDLIILLEPYSCDPEELKKFEIPEGGWGKEKV